MNFYDSKNGSGVFVQIGAGAGDLDIRSNYKDGFTTFVKKLPREHVKKIILVEPNPANIPLLKECWKDYPQSIIYEIGIVPKTYVGDTIEFFLCPLDAPQYQVASVVKSHVQKHYGYDCEIQSLNIPVKEFNTFMSEVVPEEIELLAIDIEGIDAEILLNIDFSNMKLKYISFEFVHLGNKRADVLKYLQKNNYEFLGLGVDYYANDYLYINKAYQ